MKNFGEVLKRIRKVMGKLNEFCKSTKRNTSICNA